MEDMGESSSSKQAASSQRQPPQRGQLRACLAPTTGRTSGVSSVTSTRGRLEGFVGVLFGFCFKREVTHMVHPHAYACDAMVMSLAPTGWVHVLAPTPSP